MKSSLKLFSCSIPISPEGLVRSSSFTSVNSSDFLTHIRRNPALELVSQLCGGNYQILTLPSGSWSSDLEHALDVPPPSIESGTISLEGIPLSNGAQAILPHRALPWIPPEDTGSIQHSLTAGLAKSQGAIHPNALFEPTTASDRLLAELCKPNESLHELLQICREREEEFSPQSHSLEEDLWLDLLRCAGSPNPLPEPTSLLVRALLPALRFLLRFHFEPKHISRALEAFVLWLEATHELEPTRLCGNDIFELQAFALPTLMVLVHADAPLQPFEVRSPATVQFFNAIQKLRAHEPLGLEVLKAFRTIQYGGVMAVRELGELLLEAQVAQNQH